MEKKENHSYLDLIIFLIIFLVALSALVDSSFLKKPYHFDELKYLEMSSLINFMDIFKNFNPISLSDSPLMQIISKISIVLFDSPVFIVIFNSFLRIISILLLLKVIDCYTTKNFFWLKLIVIFDPLQNYYAISYLKETQVSFGIILFFYSFYFKNYRLIFFSLIIVILSRNVFTPFLIVFLFYDFFMKDKFEKNKILIYLSLASFFILFFLLKDQIISFLILRNEIIFNEGSVFFDNTPKHKIFSENIFRSIFLIASEVFILPNIIYANSYKELFYSISILLYILPVIYYLVRNKSINLNLLSFSFLIIILMIILTTPYYSSEVRYKDIILKILFINICFNKFNERN